MDTTGIINFANSQITLWTTVKELAEGSYQGELQAYATVASNLGNLQTNFDTLSTESGNLEEELLKTLSREEVDVIKAKRPNAIPDLP